MPTDKDSGLVEPDIVVNGRALTFAECMSVRVAVSSFRLSLTSKAMRKGLGELADNYDHHLARVEDAMRRGAHVTLTVHGFDGEPFDIEVDDELGEQLAAYVQAVYAGDWSEWFNAVIAEFCHEEEGKHHG